jgi:predicted  nucleic acid-binding Zn-ribbon protein
MSQTLSLYRLQQVDSQIDRAQIRLQAIQKTLEDDNELRLAKERSDSAKDVYQSCDQVLKQAEVDAQSQRIKIEQTEANLYAGKGHSPKELLDLQNDVAALKRHLIVLEDIQLEAMLAVENSMVALQVAQSDFLAAQNYSMKQNRDLREELTVLQKEQEKLLAERVAVAVSIPSGDLGLYDRLRQERRGIAVAVIRDNSCSACGSGLSAAQMQSSRASEQMALCPSCGRILYGS